MPKTRRQSSIEPAAPPTPDRLSPMLACSAKKVPVGAGWLYEIKYDGYRMLARVDAGRARVFSRNDKEWTEAVPSVVAALGGLPGGPTWLDGELCALDADGRTSFHALQRALGDRRRPILYVLFDLPFLDGHDLRREPLTERRRLLQELIAQAGDASIVCSTAVEGCGETIYQAVCETGLEGVLAKRADSHYRDGYQCQNWVKVKCVRRADLLIVGYTEPKPGRVGFGALLLGQPIDGQLRYAGRVGTGFNDHLLRGLRPVLDCIEQPSPAIVDPPAGAEGQGAHWVKPQLIAHVAFTEWSPNGRLRHPSFKGLREVQ